MFPFRYIPLEFGKQDEFCHAYVKEINKMLTQCGGAGNEHALRTPFQNFLTKVTCGRVDLLSEQGKGEAKEDFQVCLSADEDVARVAGILGLIETKSLNVQNPQLDLDTPQVRILKNKGCKNLILTNYIDYHWFLDGKHVRCVSIGQVSPTGKVTILPENLLDVLCLLEEFVNKRLETVPTLEILMRRFAQMAHTLEKEIERGVKDTTGAGYVSPYRDAYEDYRRLVNANADGHEFASDTAQVLVFAPFFQRLFPWIKDTAANHYLTFFQGAVHPDGREWAHVRVRHAIEHLLSEITDTELHKGILHDLDGPENNVSAITAYERFLAAYNPVLKQERGVYYTPFKLADHCVREADRMLKEDQGIPLGLADPNVLIMDLACGTGVFLLAAIRHIHRFVTEELHEDWVYHARVLAQRMAGFELMYMARLISKINLAAYAQSLPGGEPLKGGIQFNIFLKDSTKEPQFEGMPYHGSPLRELGVDFAEGEAWREKHDSESKPLVILGNPPWNGRSQNHSAWLTKLMAPWKGQDRKSGLIGNDYIKFLRIADEMIHMPGSPGGVICMTLQNAWLVGGTYATMRGKLTSRYGAIHILDLHGDKRENPPEGVANGNIFDVTVGNCVFAASFRAGKDLASSWVDPSARKITFSEVWGTTSEKKQALSVDYPRQRVTPSGPEWSFRYRGETPTTMTGDTEASLKGHRVSKVFITNACAVSSGRDTLATAMSRKALEANLSIFMDLDSVSDAKCTELLNCKDLAATRKAGELEAPLQWDMRKSRIYLAKTGIQSHFIRDIWYRPFDKRVIYFDPALIHRTRARSGLDKWVDANIPLLCILPALTDYSTTYRWCVPLEGNALVSDTFLGTDSGSLQVYPIFLVPKTGEGLTTGLTPEFIFELTHRLGVPFNPQCVTSQLPNEFETEWSTYGLYLYFLGVLHDPHYIQTVQKDLQGALPRVPWPHSLEEARFYMQMGARLRDYYCPDRWEGNSNVFDPRFLGSKPSENPNFDEANGYPYDQILKKPLFSAEDTDKDSYTFPCVAIITEGILLRDFPCAAATFKVGNYLPASKWLQDRHKSKQHGLLTGTDLLYYRKMVTAMGKLAEIISEIQDQSPYKP